MSLSGSTVSRAHLGDDQLAMLRPLAAQAPNVDAAVGAIARLSAELTLPRGTVHVISDIHGEDKKLRHVINNASGTLRPLVERLFKGRLDEGQFRELLTLIFYPAEVVERLRTELPTVEQQKAFAGRVLGLLFEVVRALAADRTLPEARAVFPPEYRELLTEIRYASVADHDPAYVGAIVDQLARRGRALHLVHLTCRAIRNLAIDELIIAGDCWDRGPRGDRVVDYLMRQPNVAFTWGNHDAAWLGACLGHAALVCHVLRISLRYRRLSQLEEGYGIPVQPLDHLVREVYGADDPAEHFEVKGEGLRDTTLMRRMQKAAAVMQFKLEGQMIARHPEWRMDHRRLLHRMDLKAGTIEIDGRTYPLLDTRFPTINPERPYDLTAQEQACVARIRQSFLQSEKLWRHMQWMVGIGRMALAREEVLIFHACVPCDKAGAFQPMYVRGVPYQGRALFEELDRTIYAMMEEEANRSETDLDLCWYLWSGPESPLFGKDKITTLERDLVADETTHEEKKNAYFSLIHEPWFCEKVLREFGVDPNGLIVNGHVPVKIEKGENPLKRSGKAITIDGAFSEAYGDHGYTLVLEPDRIALAEHSHFESVEAAVREGADIIPKVTTIRQFDPPRRVADGPRGARIRSEMAQLEQLIDAYHGHDLAERSP
jgi:fructose-1,6-bisphosphatase III